MLQVDPRSRPSMSNVSWTACEILKLADTILSTDDGQPSVEENMRIFSHGRNIPQTSAAIWHDGHYTSAPYKVPQPPLSVENVDMTPALELGAPQPMSCGEPELIEVSESAVQDSFSPQHRRQQRDASPPRSMSAPSDYSGAIDPPRDYEFCIPPVAVRCDLDDDDVVKDSDKLKYHVTSERVSGSPSHDFGPARGRVKRFSNGIERQVATEDIIPTEDIMENLTSTLYDMTIVESDLDKLQSSRSGSAPYLSVAQA